MIQTVLGPIPHRQLGTTDGHTHVWIDDVLAVADDAPVLNDAQMLVAGLRAFRAAGGHSVIDCQPGGCGRNGNQLADLARAGGVHIIAATGFHRRIYYPPTEPLWTLDAEQAAALFVSELRAGVTETRAGVTETRDVAEPVRAGFIKVAGEATLAETAQHLLAAAAHACQTTGCAIQMHTERGAAVEAFLHFFQDHGVAAERIIFCHVDKRPDFGFHQTIAQSGALLAYDTFFRPKYRPEERLWPLLRKMIDADLAGQLVLASDMADPAFWRGAPGGPAAFVTHVVHRLAAEGVPAETIAALTGGNVARCLALRRVPQGEIAQ